MESANTRSAGVTAAAALAIMGSITVLFLWGFFLQNMLREEIRKVLFHRFPLIFLLLAFGPPLLVAVGIRTGIGLFRLRPWARTLALGWAGVALSFCLAIIALRPFETFVIPDHFVSDVESFKQLLVLSALILYFPLSVWWIFYFRLPSVKRQFEVPARAASPAVE